MPECTLIYCLKVKFKKREIRVTSCGRRTKRAQNQKSEAAPKATPPAASSLVGESGPSPQGTEGGGSTDASRVTFEATENAPSSQTKKRKRLEDKKDSPAVRRMKMKVPLFPSPPHHTTPHHILPL